MKREKDETGRVGREVCEDRAEESRAKAEIRYYTLNFFPKS